MLTAFGKVLRKMRIDRGEILKKMSDRLGISAAHLSAVEMGTRTIPDGLVADIIRLYDVTENEKNDLFGAAAETKKAVRLNLDGIQHGRKETAVLFAREFDNLDDGQLQRIREILTRGNTGGATDGIPGGTAEQEGY